jgi:hypothetical protein
MLRYVQFVERYEASRSQYVIRLRAGAMASQTEREGVKVRAFLSDSPWSEMRCLDESIRPANDTAESAHHRQIFWISNGLLCRVYRSGLDVECLRHDSEYTKAFACLQVAFSRESTDSRTGTSCVLTLRRRSLTISTDGETENGSKNTHVRGNGTPGRDRQREGADTRTDQGVGKEGSA